MENNIAILSETLQKNNLIIEENTKEQILDLTIEIYERLTNNFKPNFNNETLKSKFRSYWKPTSRSYGYVCNISSKFLEQKNDLFLKKI